MAPRPFLEIADIYEQRGEAKMRDRFLILAADAAYAAGKTQEADRLLLRLLQGSPHHLLKAYHSFGEALRADVVRPYLTDLRQNYPPEIVETLLQSLRGGSGVTALPAAPSVAAPLASADDQTAILKAPVTPVPTDVYGIEGGDTVRLPTRPQSPPPSSSRSDKSTLSPARPAATAAMPPASAPQPPVASPIAPLRLTPAEDQPGEPAEGEPPGSWLAALLFGVVITLGLAAAIYALARPFLPPGWLP
jgi:hypothetical protein